MESQKSHLYKYTVPPSLADRAGYPIALGSPLPSIVSVRQLGSLPSNWLPSIGVTKGTYKYYIYTTSMHFRVILYMGIFPQMACKNPSEGPLNMCPSPRMKT